MANRHKFSPNRISEPPHDPPSERERCYGDDSISGKTIFEDEDIIKREAGRIFNEDGTELGYYQCVHCHKWHFTSVDRHKTLPQRRGRRR